MKELIERIEGDQVSEGSESIRSDLFKNDMDMFKGMLDDLANKAKRSKISQEKAVKLSKKIESVLLSVEKSL